LASHGSSGAIVFHKYSPGYFLLLLAVAGLIALTLLAQSRFSIPDSTGFEEKSS